MSQYSKRAKIHTPYFTKNKERASGVTTILDVLAKPALIYWAWDLGTKGIDYRTHRDELADVGTLAHDMILNHIRGNETDTSEYSKRLIDLAENSFLSYLEWEKQHKLEPLFMERALITEDPAVFGGRPDYVGKVDGIPTLMDFKTGKRLYDNQWYQVAGYNLILSWGYFMDTHEPINYFPEQFILLNIPRKENEQFEQGKKTALTLDTKVFMAALEIYRTEKLIKKINRQ